MDSLSAKVKEILQSSPEFERLNDWYNIGAVQRATLEEFTTEVVKKCANLVNIWTNEKPCSEGYDVLTVSKIKEHFGIKE